MNRLRSESSPYLRQHAANPVDWYPWGPEALARARKEHKPILVSIGYSTCHWCHVMERESFEDPTVAAIMNDYFVNIKVDREERPDLDQLYMDACQALTGQGGWPLHVFLTPELRPFHAGTYFPPTPGHRRPSWLQALEYAAYNFYENRDAVERQADRILAALASAEKKLTEPVLSGPETEDPFAPKLPAAIYQELRLKFDPEAGGFDRAPKFPNTMALEFLLHYHWYTGSEEALRHALFSIDRMLAGGTCDQLGGGLFRYSTDREWLAPHFEKMLYDNALFASLLADTYRLTRRADYREALELTLGFVERELTREEGGFYAALDADTHGEEGRFYTWTMPEAREVLGEEADLAATWFDISEKGNWEGKSILRRQQSLETLARARGETAEDLRARLEGIRRRLFEQREKRPRPHRDEKILLNWNALQVTAYAKAAAALGRADYRETAVRHLDFLLSTFLQADGSLRHSYAGCQTRFPAYLNDYAFLIEALLEVYAVSFDDTYLGQAKALAETVLAHFHDPEDRLFFFTDDRADELVLRRKEVYDAEMPSGSAAMARNLQRLGLLFDRPDWRRAATDALLAMRKTVRKDPLPFAYWATNLLEESCGYAEIAIVGDQADAMARELQQDFLPAHVLMAATEARDDFPLLRDRPGGKETFLYLCRDYACRRPVGTVGELRAMLKDQGS